jgi:hypothetical protein
VEEARHKMKWKFPSVNWRDQELNYFLIIINLIIVISLNRILSNMLCHLLIFSNNSPKSKTKNNRLIKLIKLWGSCLLNDSISIFAFCWKKTLYTSCDYVVIEFIYIKKVN